MTNYGDTTAWITLSYGSDVLYLNCEDWNYNEEDPSLILLNYPNKGHFGLTLDAEAISITLKNVYVNTEADWNILKAQLRAAKIATKTLLSIKVSSTTYELFDGVTGHDAMPVKIKTKNGMHKRFRGEATNYVIENIILVQSGDLE